MKDRKSRVEFFSLQDKTGIEKHIEEMAIDGWLIDKINRITWEYKKIKPRKIKAEVVYFPDASDIDSNLNRSDGWKSLCTTGHIQILGNDDEEATFIVPDASSNINSMHQVMKKKFCPVWFILSAICLLFSVMFLTTFCFDQIKYLSSPTSILFSVISIIGFIFFFEDITSYYIWRRKAKKMAKQGYFLETKTHLLFQKLIFYITIICVIFIYISILLSGDPLKIISYILFLLCFLIPNIIINKHSRRSEDSREKRVFNSYASVSNSIVIILFVFIVGSVLIDKGIIKYGEKGIEAPVYLEDIKGENFFDYIAERGNDQSVLFKQEKLNQIPKESTKGEKKDRLMYVITEPKFNSLYDFAKNKLVRKQEIVYKGKMKKLKDPSIWNANEVYNLRRKDKNIYILVYDGCIVELNINWIPNQNERNVMSEAFRDIKR